MATGYCENCGQKLEAGDVFCLNCGYMVRPATEDSATSPAMPIAHESLKSAPPIHGEPNVSESSRGTSGAEHLEVISNSSTQVAQATVKHNFCPECGSKVRSHWSFCMKCGQSLMAGVRSQAAGVSAQAVAQAKVQSANVELSAANNVDAVQTRVGTAKVSTDSFSLPTTILSGTDAQIRFDRMNSDDDEGDDSLTIVFEEDEDIDSPTIIYDGELDCVYKLYRRRTNEEYILKLPATIGKGSAASVRISGSRIISRIHAKVYETNGQVFIEDYASTNKTYVNNVQLSPNRPVVIQSGDTIRLADEEFGFVIE